MRDMRPQLPGFKRGGGKKLENLIRKIAESNEEVYVVTGPILTDGLYEIIGENAVAIPTRYFKVVLDYKEPGIKAIGVILPHERSSEPLSAFVVSVDVVEWETGLDFFHVLEDGIEEGLEGVFDFTLWG